MKSFQEYLIEMNHALMPRHEQHAVEDADQMHTGHSHVITHEYGDHEHGHTEAQAYVAKMHSEFMNKGYKRVSSLKSKDQADNFYKKGDKTINVRHDADGSVRTSNEN